MEAAPYVAVVDDERSVALAVGRLICSAGYSVKTFTSGTELLQSLELCRPHCVLADLHLADMSGTLLQQLIARRAPGVPVIIMSGQDSAASRTEAIAAGARTYLVKPIDEAVLLEAIEDALSRHSNERSG